MRNIFYPLLTPYSVQELFEYSFREHYGTIHRYETNKLRNVAKFYAFLLHTDGIPWSVLECVHLNEEETTSSR